MPDNQQSALLADTEFASFHGGLRDVIRKTESDLRGVLRVMVERLPTYLTEFLAPMCEEIPRMFTRSQAPIYRQMSDYLEASDRMQEIERVRREVLTVKGSQN